MYNWSTDIRRLKENIDEYTKWKLEQQVNFGLCGKKMKAPLLRKYLEHLSIDPQKKEFLHHILYA